jgi:hypothetical protein
VKRAPVQGHPNKPRASPGHAPGTISWDEHMEAWQEYQRRYHTHQSAERIVERGGFSYDELVLLLKRIPKTWEPVSRRSTETVER